MREYQPVYRLLQRRGFLNKEEVLSHPALASKVRAPRIPKQKKPVSLTKSPRRQLSKDDIMRIVFLRYGSIVSFGDYHTKQNKIAAKLHLAP